MLLDTFQWAKADGVLPIPEGVLPILDWMPQVRQLTCHTRGWQCLHWHCRGQRELSWDKAENWQSGQDCIA